MKKLLKITALALALGMVPQATSAILIDKSVKGAEVSNYTDELNDIAKNLTLNFDTTRVVSSFVLPSFTMYGCNLSYTSSDETHMVIDNGYALITRPEADESDVKVTLTAKISIREASIEKKFELTILKKKVSTSSSTTVELEEDFSSYLVGEEISEYASWNLRSGVECATIVDSVPNNNLIKSQNALKIESRKSAASSVYERKINVTGNVVMEGYMMYYGSINEVTFQAARGTQVGASIGFSKGSICYTTSGSSITTGNPSGFTPAEGVWTKFRLEINASGRMYKPMIYNYDGGFYDYGDTSMIYAGSATQPIDTIRIRVNGGDGAGQVYLSDLKLKAAIPEERTNPNRTDGIGNIEGFTENVLHIEGDPDNYTPELKVYNRFDSNQLYVEGTDYSVTTTTETSGSTKINTYTITLTSTGETKELVQYVYEDATTNPCLINDFKVSNLHARSATDSTVVLNITGGVTRSDSTVHYAVVNKGQAGVTKDLVTNHTVPDAVANGSVTQTERFIDIEIEGLNITKEYDVYVVTENPYGTSDLYVKTDVSNIINLTTAEEFYDMTVNTSSISSTFRLMNDIDFDGFYWATSATIMKFAGVLDGQGHTIKNLTIDSAFRKAAIFTEIAGATIKDLTIENFEIRGLQDTAILAGFSNGGTIENVTIKDSTVGVGSTSSGSEGYFGMLFGRLHENTTTVNNVVVDECLLESTKYSGVLTGNVNKADKQCVLNVTDFYAKVDMRSDGAALGLIGRNRGTSNLTNIVAHLNVLSAKKEVGVVAGQNTEGGKLNVKNLVGMLDVREITQNTYFNNFIGTHAQATSSYTYENVTFIQADYSNLSDSTITPINNSRTVGRTVNLPSTADAEWWEKNTFFLSFETMDYWYYDTTTNWPKMDLTLKASFDSSTVNALLEKINSNIDDTNHYYIKKALYIYDLLSAAEKAKVDYATLQGYKTAYDAFVASVDAVINGGMF